MTIVTEKSTKMSHVLAMTSPTGANSKPTAPTNAKDSATPEHNNAQEANGPHVRARSHLQLRSVTEKMKTVTAQSITTQDVPLAYVATAHVRPAVSTQTVRATNPVNPTNVSVRRAANMVARAHKSAKENSK
tara:strand:- start:3858 stop:4253 length:396 start_codon:yes stop_codon:yes gene_type:complete